MYANAKSAGARAPITVPRLHEMKAQGEKIVVLTAYDASFAAQADAAGVDVAARRRFARHGRAGTCEHAAGHARRHGLSHGRRRARHRRTRC